MDHYPQPRPALYGTSREETPAQTLTKPVRSGPPRYPPAPPLAGDAPGPFDPPPLAVSRRSHYDPVSVLLAILYAIALVCSPVQIALGMTPFTFSNVGPLTAESVMGLVVIACLVWPGSRAYLLGQLLVALHVSIALVFAQWQSP